MARGRMLSVAIAEDIEFNNMSMEAQFLFMRTIPHLDRDGLINGHPFILLGKVAPLMPQLAPTIETFIDEWISAGMVISYNDKNVRVLFFKGFSKNQTGMRYDREGASIFPPPPGYERTKDGLQPISDEPKLSQTIPPQTPPQPNGYYPQESGSSPEVVRSESGETPLEVKLKEIKTTTTRTREAKLEEPPKNGSGGSGLAEALPKNRNRQADSDYAEICSSFENNGFGTLTEIMAEEINVLLNEYPVMWIKDAMRIGVEANKRQLRYVRGVLVKWRADGRNSPTRSQSPPLVAGLAVLAQTGMLGQGDISKLYRS